MNEMTRVKVRPPSTENKPIDGLDGIQTTAVSENRELEEEIRANLKGIGYEF